MGAIDVPCLDEQSIIFLEKVGASLLGQNEDSQRFDARLARSVSLFLPIEYRLNPLYLFTLNERQLANFWLWVGLYLDAYWSRPRKTEPLKQLPDVPFKHFKKSVQLTGQRYIALSVLIFEGEEFIRAKFRELGLSDDFSQETLLLKVMTEEASMRWHIEHQEAYVFPSDSDLKLDARAVRQWMAGQEDKARGRLTKEIHLVGDVIPFEMQLWTWICHEALLDNRKQLPNFFKWVDIAFAEPAKTLGLGKLALINGELKRYPGRGKGGKTKKVKAAS